jgi:hypothetical protein
VAAYQRCQPEPLVVPAVGDEADHVEDLVAAFA